MKTLRSCLKALEYRICRLLSWNCFVCGYWMCMFVTTLTFILIYFTTEWKSMWLDSSMTLCYSTYSFAFTGFLRLFYICIRHKRQILKGNFADFQSNLYHYKKCSSRKRTKRTLFCTHSSLLIRELKSIRWHETFHPADFSYSNSKLQSCFFAYRSFHGHKQ